MENKEENHEPQPANPTPPQKLLFPPRGPHPAPDPQSPPLDFSSKQDQQKEIPFQHLPAPAAETPVTAAPPVFEAEPTSRDQEVEGGGGNGHGKSANFKSDLWLCPPEEDVSPTREPEYELSPQSTPLDSPAHEEDDNPPFKPTISSAAETVVAGPTPKNRFQEETVERGHGNGGNENLKSNSWLYPPPERLPPPYYSPKTQSPPLDSTPLEENDTRLTYKPMSPPAAQNPVVSATFTPPTKAVPTAQDQGTAKERSRSGSRGWGYVKPNLSILKKARRDSMMKRALLGFRVSGFLICLVSFSVLAADKNRGWALDSFYLYKEFRYCMAVNVIAFVYSGFQIAYQLITGNREPGSHMQFYLDFSMDQVLTYLLLSASTSAAVRVDDWQSNWGKDLFPDMAKASVALSFLAFIAFALSSLVSGYTVFMLNTL